jgi:hypothetical protein
MKAFICSLITVFLLTAAVTVNGIYVINEADSLSEIAHSFPDSAEDRENFLRSYEEFSQRWGKFKRIVSLSVSNAEAEAVEETLELLYSRFESGSSSDMAAAKTSLISKLSELRDTESFGIGIL